jgi:BMFP domain-containing protein YqiC
MIDPKNIDGLVNSLRQALPGDVLHGMEQNLRAAWSAGLAKLDLVTREELEVQLQVLARTRARLEALEKQVADLEAQLTKK